MTLTTRRVPWWGVRCHRRTASGRNAQQGEQLVRNATGDPGARRRMLEPADGTPYPFGDPVGAVALPDPAGRAYHVHQRREVTAVTVADGAAPQHPRVRLRSRLAGEFHGNAGLADPRLAGDDDGPWPALRDNVAESGQEHREVRIAAGERRVVAVPRPGDVRRPQADQLVGGYRFTLAFELQRRQRSPGRHRGRGHHRPVSRVYRAHGGGVGQPSGGVDRVTDHRIGQRRLDAGQDLAGVDPDPQAEMASAAGFVGDQSADGLLHRGCRTHSPLGVVLVRGRRTEDRHDAVPGQVVDPSTDFGDVPGECGEYPVGDLPDAFGVEVLGPGGEVREVTEQDGDHPAFGALVGVRAVLRL